MRATSEAGSSQVLRASRPRPVRMIAVTAIWGVCFVIISWGLRYAPPLWFGSLRSLVAGIALIPFVRGRAWVAPDRRTWMFVVGLGLLNGTLAFGAMFAGVAATETGIAAVVANAQPLLILLPAWWLYGERPSLAAALALPVGFFGLLLIAGSDVGREGALVSLASAIGITGGTLLARRLRGVNVVWAASASFLIGGVALAGVAWIVEGVPRMEWTPAFFVAVLVLGTVGTAFTFVIWFREAQRAPLAQLAAWTFLVPVFGIAIGAAVLGERFGVWSGLGMALVLFSLAMALRDGVRISTPR